MDLYGDTDGLYLSSQNFRYMKIRKRIKKENQAEVQLSRVAKYDRCTLLILLRVRKAGRSKIYLRNECFSELHTFTFRNMLFLNVWGGRWRTDISSSAVNIKKNKINYSNVQIVLLFVFNTATQERLGRSCVLLNVLFIYKLIWCILTMCT